MAAVSLNSLWTFIQSLSLNASNEQWLADKLHESAMTKQKAEKSHEDILLDKLCGAWDNPDGDLIEKAIQEGRKADYAREFAISQD